MHTHTYECADWICIHIYASCVLMQNRDATLWADWICIPIFCAMRFNAVGVVDMPQYVQTGSVSTSSVPYFQCISKYATVCADWMCITCHVFLCISKHVSVHSRRRSDLKYLDLQNIRIA